jgi:hypothetical protein
MHVLSRPEDPHSTFLHIPSSSHNITYGKPTRRYLFQTRAGGKYEREREVQLRRHSIQQDALALCEDVCFTHDDDIFRRTQFPIILHSSPHLYEQ